MKFAFFIATNCLRSLMFLSFMSLRKLSHELMRRVHRKLKYPPTATLYWPTKDPAVAKLSQEITAGCSSDEQRIEAILKMATAW